MVTISRCQVCIKTPGCAGIPIRDVFDRALRWKDGHRELFFQFRIFPAEISSPLRGEVGMRGIALKTLPSSTPKSTCKIIILLLTAFVCIGWADSMEALKATSESPTSVSADFMQEKHMKILSRPLVSKGKFYYQSPGSVRWEYLSPIRSVLLMHDGEIRRYIQKNDDMIEDKGAHLQSMGIVLQEISRYLDGRFDENPSFSARMEPGRKVVLTPKEASLASLISRIELDLSGRKGLIDSVTIFESEASYTKLVFSNALLNEKIPDTLFRNLQ